VGTRQFFNEKLVLEPGNWFRFNSVLILKWGDRIGVTSKFILRETNAFIRGGNSIIF
jgi:hypothetical protein